MKEESRLNKIDPFVLRGKKIVLGVTGCIAAYKSCYLLSLLKKAGAEVKVVMTKNAENFVGKITFETLSKNRVIDDTFSHDFPWEVEHISLAKWADLFLIAPATANIIGKIANGIADDMLSTTVMATTAKKMFCPAMNTEMFNNPVTQANIKKLAENGAVIIEPEVGSLACGDVGKGRFPEPEYIFDEVLKVLKPDCDLAGKTVVVTAGGTSEPIDPVRFITNRSSGKMGVAIANECVERGARVILVHGNVSVALPCGAECVSVSTTEEMKNAVMERFDVADAFVMAAAPADYRPAAVSDKKIKSENLTLELTKNPDIAKAIGEKKGDKKLVVFAAETDNLLNNAREKLIKKNADFVVLNDVTKEGAGFSVDTNIVTVIDRDSASEYGLLEKTEVAKIIVDKLFR